MKFLISQLAFITADHEQRANLRSLLKYFAFLAVLVATFAVLFHVIKANVEGEQHSWITGLYWTLVVMSTLGFGDITFTSDIGRAFSIVVLLSGVVFLLVMLPFLFIRLFYAPWLEARVRLSAPRSVPPDTSRARHHRAVRRHRRRADGAAACRGHPALRDRAGPRGGRPNDGRTGVGRHRRQRQPPDLRGAASIGRPADRGQLRRHDQHQHHADGRGGRAEHAGRGVRGRGRLNRHPAAGRRARGPAAEVAAWRVSGQPRRSRPGGGTRDRRAGRPQGGRTTGSRHAFRGPRRARHASATADRAQPGRVLGAWPAAAGVCGFAD